MCKTIKLNLRQKEQTITASKQQQKASFHLHYNKQNEDK